MGNMGQSTKSVSTLKGQYSRGIWVANGHKNAHIYKLHQMWRGAQQWRMPLEYQGQDWHERQDIIRWTLQGRSRRESKEEGCR